MANHNNKANHQYRLNDILCDLVQQPASFDYHDDNPLCKPGKRLSDLTVLKVVKPAKRRRYDKNIERENPSLSTIVRVTDEERRASWYADESYIASVDENKKLSSDKNKEGTTDASDVVKGTVAPSKLTFNEVTTDSPPALVSRLQGILDAYLPRSLHDGTNATDEFRPKSQQQQRTKIMDRHTGNISSIPSRVQEIRRIYLYGLQYVSELQDLQKAPDAILPGNFIDSSTLK